MLAIKRTIKRGIQFARWMLAASLCLALSSWVAIQAGEPAHTEGSSSRDSRELARRGIPLTSLTPQAVAKLRPVLEDPTIFRRMPTQSIVCDPEMFNFIIRYPEVLVEIWQLMGMTHVTVERKAAFSFDGQDGAGTTCRCELILGSDKLHIYYAEGDYEGGLISRKLNGRCVCVLQSQPAIGEAGQSVVTASMDVFLKLDNVGADLIGKTISPLVVKTADYNYIESLRFISQLSTAAQRNPQAVEQLAARLEGLQPDVRNRFVQLVHQSAIRRERLVSKRSQQTIEANAEASITIGNASPTRVPTAEPITNVPASEGILSGEVTVPASTNFVR